MPTGIGFAGETRQRRNESFLVPNGQTNKDNKKYVWHINDQITIPKAL